MIKPRTFDVLRLVASSDGPSEGAVRDRFRAQAIEYARAHGIGRARMAFDLAALEGPVGPVLSAGGAVFDAPRLVPISGELTMLAFGCCTVGAEIGAEIATLFAQRRVSLALALDRLGNQMLREASRLMQDAILAHVRRRGLTMAGELRPGDPGLALEAQRDVLRLAGASAIGVACSAGLSLTPLKSSSVVYGVGRDLPKATWSRCDDCRSRDKCALFARAAA